MAAKIEVAGRTATLESGRWSSDNEYLAATLNALLPLAAKAVARGERDCEDAVARDLAAVFDGAFLCSDAQATPCTRPSSVATQTHQGAWL